MSPILKTCSRCGVEKPLSEFNKDKRAKTGRKSQCRDCSSEVLKEWRKVNPDKVRESQKRWVARNKDKIREGKRKYRASNREKVNEYNRLWRRQNPEKSQEYCRKWRQANPDKLKTKTRRRRAAKANADGTCTTEQWKARLMYHGTNTCYYCKCHTDEIHCEHRIPLSRGGTNWPANLVPACPTCNLSKGTKTEKEFLDNADS